MSELLTGPQELAVQALAGGAHIIEAAQLAGVARETVSRWKARPDFAEELRRRRDAIWAAHEDRLIKMVGESLDGLYALTHGPEYYGRDENGRSFYDPRVRLDAIRLVLHISGLVQSERGAGLGLAVQVNVAQQQVHNE